MSTTGGALESETARPGGPSAPRRPLGLLALAGLFFVACLAVYLPALEGPYVFDDLHYLAQNRWVRTLDLASVVEIWRPGGDVVRVVENYAPVHLLGHAGAYAIFGDWLPGHHLLNLALHALVCALFVLLLLKLEVWMPLALSAGAVLALHPANVEAVAWISQLKTTGAMALGISAVLLAPRRPVLGTLLFAGSLLAKATGLFALAFVGTRAVVLAWREGPSALARREWVGLALWLGVAAAFCVVQLEVFTQVNAKPPGGVPDDPGLRLLRAVAVLPRYLVMGLTGLGTSTFHKPAVPESWLDPHCLAGFAILAAAAGRGLYCLAARRLEAAFWAWAAVVHLPVSQVFPFAYPLADRYLYPLLPALLGALLLPASRPVERLLRGRDRVRIAAAAAAALLLVAFALQARERAKVWQGPLRVMLDAARHYPDGDIAHLLDAFAAGRRGDRAQALAALRVSYARGYESYRILVSHPALASLAGDPEFQEMIDEMAGRQIARVRARRELTQSDCLELAHAHLQRGEVGEARAALRRGLALPGRFRQELLQIQAALP